MPKSNFNFLEATGKSEKLIERCRRAEELVRTPYYDDAPMNMRKALGVIINSIYGFEKLKNTGSLYEKINNPYFQKVVHKPSILNTLHSLRMIGNDSSHDDDDDDDDLPKVTQSQVSEAIRNLHSICIWYSKKYYKLKNIDNYFDDTLLNTQTIPDLKKLERENNAKSTLILKQIKEEDPLIEKEFKILKIAYTEQIRDKKPCVFMDILVNNQNYFCVQFYSQVKSGKPYIDRFIYREGKFAENDYYQHFKNYFSRYIHEVSDKKELESSLYEFQDEKFSSIIDKLHAKINKNVVNSINNDFEFKGSYYKINQTNYRNQLTISSNKKHSNFDACVIMINPGGSYPLNANNISKVESFREQKTLFTECKPDKTQYQITRLMNLKDWKNVVVINLFDICEPSSEKVINSVIQSNLKWNEVAKNSDFVKENLKQSIFHKEREIELKLILNEMKKSAPIIIAWGTDIRLLNMKKNVLEKEILKDRQFIGDKKVDYQFYHPYPRNNESKKEIWPDLILSQIK